MNKLISILFFFSISCSLFGQEELKNKRTYFTAKAIDNEDNKIYIPFAHVFNESLRTSAISDTSGVITIRANLNDTLVITAVGYYPKLIVVDKQQINPEFPIQTILERRTYNIQEVSVLALGTYQQFKTKVKNLDLPYTKAEKLRAELKEQCQAIAREAYAMASNERRLAEHPNDIRIIGTSIPSREDIQLKRYKEIIKQEARKEVIYSKFNKIIIKNITDLEEPELTDFYVFCNFNEEFLYDATDYEVGEAIKNKFAIYLAMREEKINDTIAN